MFQAVNENNSQEQSATGKPFSSTRDPSGLNPAPTIVRNSHQAPTHPPAQHTAPYRLTGTPYEANHRSLEHAISAAVASSQLSVRDGCRHRRGVRPSSKSS